ncbi:MAG: ATP-binding cassette domain-containing protein [Cytophagales bacterium]|nr:MAG: ATP-binding cassette domain-containing protein [Cytophagales bacterium]
MSENVLKAIIQLLAISASVDGEVSSSEREVTFDFIEEHLSTDQVTTYIQLFDEYTQIALKAQLQTTNIIKKINTELNQKQKIVVLFHLLELIGADGTIHQLEENFVDKTAEAFNISLEYYQEMKQFALAQRIEDIEVLPNILVINNKKQTQNNLHLFKTELNSTITVLRLAGMEMYMIKFFEADTLTNTFLNGLPLKDKHIYTLSNGASIRNEKITPIYYSDVVAAFLKDKYVPLLSFSAENISHVFPEGKGGLHQINISEDSGKLIGIMGASGSGKSTLLNVLNGTITPLQGSVQINGIDIHDPDQKKKLEGVIGYVPQDDLLIEELTVYQNLYYAAKLCFSKYDETQINELIDHTLVDLGLSEIKHLRVGNPLQKVISGGQRKRLNIGLELLREPSVLFVDEPTSGLSSNDSENILDLLKELALKGKLIFVVIHQPSSDIFKMFDKLVILDVGGYQIYYGNPIDAVIYFRQQAGLINSELGFCDTCGNVNPEQIFNIIEAKLVDEYGQYTEQRKVIPVQWYERFQKHFTPPTIQKAKGEPPHTQLIPKRWKQFWIFAARDLRTKFSNKQYLAINLFVSPGLAFILSSIVRYYHIDQSEANTGFYLFAENVNIPAYLFMSIIVALFVGLTVSAEEIIKDAKIRKREAFLHLSRGSYLASKITILFGFSAFQMLCFVLIGNFILGIQGMYFDYWLVLFATACFANMLGLNISSAFRSAITVYILIPILLIPQLILGGIVVKFDEINPHLSSNNKVPIVSEIMASRWAFEALAVNQFKSNEYDALFFELNRTMAKADYKKVYYLPKLESKLSYCITHFKSKKEEEKHIFEKDLLLLQNEITKENILTPNLVFAKPELLNPKDFSVEIGEKLKKHLQALEQYYIKIYNKANDTKDKMISRAVKNEESKKQFLALMNTYHNKHLKELLENSEDVNRIVEINGKLWQKIYPVYDAPTPELADFFEFRTHFFAPEKHFMGIMIDTFWFNLGIIWAFTFLLYITLYFHMLREAIEVLGSVFSRKRR